VNFLVDTLSSFRPSFNPFKASKTKANKAKGVPSLTVKATTPKACVLAALSLMFLISRIELGLTVLICFMLNSVLLY
jgi:hypothetical protein